MKYRKCRKGDTIRITGDRGQYLFNKYGNIELNKGVEFGVECVLVSGEDTEGNVEIPRGILSNEHTYLDVRCIELVQAVEDKPTTTVEDKTPTVKYMYEGPDGHICAIDDSESKFAIARIWYDPREVPMGVVKAFVENIKDIVTKRKTKNSKSIMENKTLDDEFESKFGDFERQFAAMHDPSPDEIREFISTVILSSTHDSSLVDAAFKWVENKNNKTHFTFDTKTTEEWTYKLNEEEKDRFKHLPTPCAVIGFKPKNSEAHIEITKDVRRIRIDPDFLGVGEQEYDTYTVTCYIDGKEIDSVSTKSIIKAGEIAQSYETFIKYYNQKSK